jgi:hypothetical protein
MPGGLTLARRFFEECVGPLIQGRHPDLRYGAALIGPGSEVLGFDDAMSADHDWGPRLQIFLAAGDFATSAPLLMETLDGGLPLNFDGWPVSFADMDRPSDADAAAGALGSHRHGVEVFSVEGWMRLRLALQASASLDVDDWLALPEQALLESTAGDVFKDDVGDLAEMRRRLAYYPKDVWLYRLASGWRRIGEEQAFVGRAREAGDDLGSRIIAARLLRDVLRLVFLIERAYAPYSKWLGSAFRRLPAADRFAVSAGEVVSTSAWKDREAALAACCRLAAELQIERQVPGALSPVIGRYFDRPFIVINADELAEGLRAEIRDPRLRRRPLEGSVDQVSDNVAILADTSRARRLMSF